MKPVAAIYPSKAKALCYIRLLLKASERLPTRSSRYYTAVVEWV